MPEGRGIVGARKQTKETERVLPGGSIGVARGEKIKDLFLETLVAGYVKTRKRSDRRRKNGNNECFSN